MLQNLQHNITNKSLDAIKLYIYMVFEHCIHLTTQKDHNQKEIDHG